MILSWSQKMFALVRFLEHGLDTPLMLCGTCTKNVRTPKTKTGNLVCDTSACEFTVGMEILKCKKCKGS